MDNASSTHDLVSLINRRHAERAESIRSALSDALGKLEAQISTAPLVRGDELEAMLPRQPAAAGGADHATLRKQVAAIDDDRNQVNILKTLLQAAHAYASRVAIFVVRGDSFTVWAALGFTGNGSATDERVKSVSMPLASDTVLRQVTTATEPYTGGPHAHAGNDQLFEAIGSLEPVELAAFPLSNKGRVAAVLYADSGNSTEGLGSADAIEVLARTAAMSIELIPMRGKATAQATTSTGAPAGAVRAAAPPAAPAESAPVARPTPSAPAPAAVSKPGAPDLSGLPPEEQKLHEAARRFARLLVSEIKLYNEAKVMDGRRSRDLYGKLKDDIDRSKQMYYQRVNQKIAQTTNYFYDELVSSLADGDSSLLGGYTS